MRPPITATRSRGSVPRSHGGSVLKRKSNIARLTSRGDVQQLISVLSERDLVKSADGDLIDVSVGIRAEAASALGTIDDPAASAALTRAAASDPDVRVRTAAAFALGETDDPDAVGALVEFVCALRSRDDGPARATAASRLDLIPAAAAARFVEVFLGRSSSPELDQHEQWVMREFVAGDEEKARASASALVSWLGSDPVRASRAGEALVEVAPWGVAELLDALSDSNLAPRAAEVLGRRREADALDHLMHLIRAEEPASRRAAAVALGELRDPMALQSLLAAATDPIADVRIAAAQALDKFGSVGLFASMASLLAPLMQDLPRAAGEPSPSLPMWAETAGLSELPRATRAAPESGLPTRAGPRAQKRRRPAAAVAGEPRESQAPAEPQRSEPAPQGEVRRPARRRRTTAALSLVAVLVVGAVIAVFGSEAGRTHRHPTLVAGVSPAYWAGLNAVMRSLNRTSSADIAELTKARSAQVLIKTRRGGRFYRWWVSIWRTQPPRYISDRSERYLAWKSGMSKAAARSLPNADPKEISAQRALALAHSQAADRLLSLHPGSATALNAALVAALRQIADADGALALAIARGDASAERKANAALAAGHRAQRSTLAKLQRLESPA